MNIKKRGDHLFAAGLWKTIRDVAESVRTQIGQYSEGRVLTNELLLLLHELGGSEFQVTINKGLPVTGGDPHADAFGEAVRRFKLDMESLVFALKYRRSIDERNQNLRAELLTQANRQLATAKQHAMLTVGQFVDAVIDPKVLGQILTAEPKERARIQKNLGINIEDTRIKLGSLRHAIIDTIAKM
jgi:hypothetical protein